MIQVGLIGCGRIGNVHALSAERNPRVCLSAVFDPSAGRAQTAADRFRCAVASSVEDLTRSDQIDAIVIASPTSVHQEQFLAAARAGKAIYGEKPIDNNLQRAYETVMELRRSSAHIMIGLNRRFDRDHAALRADVQAGQVGRIQSMQLASRGPNSVPTPDYLRGSGGFYRDKCVHFFDLIRWISGEEPVDVVAMGSVIADASVAEADDVDTATILMRLASGGLAHVDNARRAVYGYDDRIEVFGTAGLIESSRVRRGNVMRIAADGSIRHDGLPRDSFERYSDSYAAAFDAFVDAVAGISADIPTIDDGFMAQIIAEAATVSARERRIVSIKEILDSLTPV
jgi:myo-inositol 2-dehydrogenase/D-chiro-inositol 1-dehydrogenase